MDTGAYMANQMDNLIQSGIDMNDEMERLQAENNELKTALQRIWDTAEKCLDAEGVFTKRDLKYVIEIRNIADKHKFRAYSLHPTEVPT